MKVLFIDNFDSFTYNLVDEFRRLGADITVFRNNIGMDRFRKIMETDSPDLIVLGPGPSAPKNAGICLDVIREFHRETAVFGVCLGHQCIVEAFGGTVDICRETFHGKPSMIRHDGKGIFRALPMPLQVGRYHSLDAAATPDCLNVTADFDGIVMAVEHRELPVYGVQFHPESILTPYGRHLISNILETEL